MSIEKENTSKIKDIHNSFESYIKNKGIEFENNVIKLMKQKVEPDEFVTICNSGNNFNKRILEYEQITIDEIKKGTPVIYQPVLMNRSGKLKYTFGIPDLLVRSDYLCKITPNNHIMDNPLPPDASGANPKGLPDKPNNCPERYYVVVDIKFTTLELCSDGKRIRNSACFPAYKSQLYVYNHALGIIQGYEPPVAYIMGRKIKYMKMKNIYRCNNCFESIGYIEYNDWDKPYIKKTREAVKWIKKLRKNGNKWTLLPTPSVNELYPNMCNMMDNKWSAFKSSYAQKIGEITLLWNCGVKHRKIAHQNGVFSIKDIKCDSTKLGINGLIQGPLLNSVISINKITNFSTSMDRIDINYDVNDPDNWLMYDGNIRISIDFETIGCIFDDFKQLPIASDINYLFMIGVSYRIKNNPIKYKMFLLPELSVNAELQLVIQFYKFIKKIIKKHVDDDVVPPLCHYGHFERSFFVTLCTKLKKILGIDACKKLDKIQKYITWFDLARYIKRNQIVVNGCYKFGLKEIAGRLEELGLINTKWPKSTSSEFKPDNGSTAMIMAYNEYKKIGSDKMTIQKSPIMKNIMEYNKVDCLVIHEIMDLIGKKISGESIEKFDMDEIIETKMGNIMDMLD